MNAFTIHTVETAPEAAKAKLAQVEKGWGFIPTLHGTLAESPETLEAYDTLFGLVSKTSLTPQEQQVAFLAVSVLHECEYCTMGHTYLGRAAKLDEQAIAALRGGTPIANAKLQALRVFTETVVRERGFAGGAAVEAFLAAGFTRQNLLEVVTVIATKTISNYVNHLTHTPKESFMADAALAWVAPRNRVRAA
jgi:AhpD family alkylhydroperoxidase